MSGNGHNHQSSKAIAGPFLVGLLAISLGACSSSTLSSKSDVDNITTGSIPQGSIRETATTRKAWLADQKNLRKGMAYSRQLEALGQNNLQLSLLEQLIKSHPTNTKLQVLYGKKLINAGQSAEAVKILKQAESRGERDWRMYSALGSALDQTARHTQARQYYQKALQLNPNEVKIQNNLAMSYTLEGKFSNAETILRKANSTPQGRALPRIRQNLALVVGLQGRFNEARQIASRDLPPAQVEANMAYLKKMLGQGDTWSKLKKS
jgi:Flp pilus assembly protein TadD